MVIDNRKVRVPSSVKIELKRKLLATRVPTICVLPLAKRVGFP
jgi:hypothetical protein